MLTIAKKSNNVDFIRFSYDLGVRNFRFNMDYENEALTSIEIIRALNLKDTILFADFQGVKIRVQLMPNVNQIEIKVGDSLYFYREKGRFPFLTNLNLYLDFIKEGTCLIFADGKIKAIVNSVDEVGFIVKFTKVDYVLRQNAGCSIINDCMPTPHITPSICESIKNHYLIQQKKIDWIILSFVEKIEDIQQFVNDMHALNIRVMAKIETPNGVENIPHIATGVDGIMIGRGDLKATSGNRYEKLYKFALKSISTLTSKFVGVGTFFLSKFSETCKTEETEILEIEYLKNHGINFVMLSKEVVNSVYPFETVKLLQNFCENEYTIDSPRPFL